MKLSEQWLRQWVNPSLDAQQIGEQLTMAGLELDELTQVARPFSGVVVGQVLVLEPHPDADRLKIAQVAVGQETPLQIVCGASNVAVGQKVPVALVGAVLPPIEGKDFVIKKGKLRGIESFGMLCGGSEIDCDDGVDGLLVLPDDAPIGQDIRSYLGLDDHVLDIAITPNRGDCFSVCGVARELAAINGLPFALPFDVAPVPPQSSDCQRVLVHTQACPRYLTQVLTDLKLVPSPKFMQDALRRSGISPKNIVVDATNYVMLELGQPLHAFDKDKIEGDIAVRLAQAGESLVLLNEQTIVLAGDELVIADGAGVIALAGIMGGIRTAVDENTTNVLLECAFFAPEAIAGRSRRFGLHTDASLRFERGVDFDLPTLALDRAVALIAAYTQATVGQKSCHESLADLPKRTQVVVPIHKVKSLLGVEIGLDKMVRLLQAIGLESQPQDGVLLVQVPSHRFDIEIYQDVIEEIARLYGYDKIGGRLPAFLAQMQENTKEERLWQIKHALSALGYFEAISFSFGDEKVERLFDDKAYASPLALANPLSSELSLMRRTLLSGLLPCVSYNLKRQAEEVRLFEVGLVFDGEQVQTLAQTPMLGMVAAGTGSSMWSSAMDFYDLKAHIQALLPSTAQVVYRPSARGFLHSGQAADIWVDGVCVGFLGKLHPSVAAKLELPDTWVGEVLLESLLSQTLPKVVPPSKFPQVRRDFAFLVDEKWQWQEIEKLARQAAGECLVSCFLFDVYQGEKLPVGKKSLAFALVWQHPTQTLDDAFIKAACQSVIETLVAKGAVLRDH